MADEGSSNRSEFLLSQYEYSKAHDLQYQGFLSKLIGGIVLSAVVGLPLWISQVLGVTNAPPPLVIALAAIFAFGLVIANFLLGQVVVSTLFNDVNALRIEDELKMSDIGLWHLWYGLRRNLGRPLRRTLSAKFCGVSRPTSYLDLITYSTLVMSPIIGAGIGFGAWTIFQDLLIATIAGAIGSIANIAVQAKFIRFRIRQSSEAFTEAMRTFSIQSDLLENASTSEHKSGSGAPPPFGYK